MSTEPKTVRDLAREYINAQSAAMEAYRASIRTDRSVEERVDALLAYEALLQKQVKARMALDEAQKVAA